MLGASIKKITALLGAFILLTLVGVGILRERSLWNRKPARGTRPATEAPSGFLGDSRRDETPESDTPGRKKPATRHSDWQEGTQYKPTEEELWKALATVDWSIPGPISSRIVRAFPDEIVDHFGPIILDPSRSIREKYDAYNIINILAEARNVRAKDFLITLIRAADPNSAVYALRDPHSQLFRCFGDWPEVQTILLQRRDTAAILGDAQAARETQESRLVDPETKAAIAAVADRDYDKLGAVLLQAQADAATSLTARNSRDYLLAVVLTLHRQELIPTLRKYIEKEKVKYGGFEEGARLDAFLEDKPLYEAVRVMNALGGELTERETEFLTFLGLIGDRPRASREPGNSWEARGSFSL